MKKYTEEDIRLAIDMCQKHIVDLKTPLSIDGMLDCKIETIECSYFLHNLDIARKRRKSEVSNTTNKIIPPPPPKPPEYRRWREGCEPPKPRSHF